MVGSAGSGGGQVGGSDAFRMVSDKQRRWPMGTVLVMVAVVLVLVGVLCLWRWLVWLVVALVLGVGVPALILSVLFVLSLLHGGVR